VVRSLRELAATLVRSNPDVEAVVLFGSLVRGDYGRRSDADILVCLRAKRADRPADRIPCLLAAFLDAPVPVDVLPLTAEEVCARLQAGDPFWRRVLSEGWLLAGAFPSSLQGA